MEKFWWAYGWIYVWFFGLDTAYQACVIAILLAPLLWLALYSFRRALGHVRHRGRWYSQREWMLFLAEIQRGEAEGRVINYEDAAALDRARYGKKLLTRKLARRSGWY